MAYIWENYSSDKFYLSGKNICPYIEVMSNKTSYVEVNPLIRFHELFVKLYDDEILDYVDNMDEVENVVFHFLAQLDKNKGLNFRQNIIEKIRNDICNGIYGSFIQGNWNTLLYEDQEIILYELSQRLLVDKEVFFMDAMNKLFPLSSLCYEKNTKIYYLYVGVENTGYNTKKYELTKYLFWNKNLTLKIVWKAHYGIVGIFDTMKIDEIQIV